MSKVSGDIWELHIKWPRHRGRRMKETNSKNRW